MDDFHLIGDHFYVPKNYDDYQLDSNGGGSGKFGIVRKLVCRQGKPPIAVKKFNYPSTWPIADPSELERQQYIEASQVMRELHLFRTTRHANLVHFFESYSVPSALGEDSYYHITQYCPHTLREKIDLGQYTLDDVRKWGRGLFRALQHLHSNSVIHNNLHPGRLFIEADNRLILQDFGRFSPDDGHCLPSEQIVRQYLPIERIVDMAVIPDHVDEDLEKDMDKDNHKDKVDVWSAAVIMCEMITGEPLFRYNAPQIHPDTLCYEVYSVLSSQIRYFGAVPEKVLNQVSNDCDKKILIEESGTAQRLSDFTGTLLEKARANRNIDATDVLEIKHLLNDFFDRILQFDPEQRMPAAHALQHKFLANRSHERQPRTMSELKKCILEEIDASPFKHEPLAPDESVTTTTYSISELLERTSMNQSIIENEEFAKKKGKIDSDEELRWDLTEKSEPQQLKTIAEQLRLAQQIAATQFKHAPPSPGEATTSTSCSISASISELLKRTSVNKKIMESEEIDKKKRKIGSDEELLHDLAESDSHQHDGMNDLDKATVPSVTATSTTCIKDAMETVEESIPSRRKETSNKSKVRGSEQIPRQGGIIQTVLNLLRPNSFEQSAQIQEMRTFDQLPIPHLIFHIPHELHAVQGYRLDTSVIGCTGSQATLKKFIAVGRPSLVIKKFKPINNKKQARQILRELHLLRSVRHENIVRLLGKYVTSSTDSTVAAELPESMSSIYHITEYCGEPLTNVILAGDYGIAQVKRWSRELLGALQYIHALDIIHRDLHPGSMCIGDTGDRKLTLLGFGNARIVENSCEFTAIVGNNCYMPIEMQLEWKKPYDEKVDIWSMATVLAEMLTGTQLFFDARNVLKKMLQYCGPVLEGVLSNVANKHDRDQIERASRVNERKEFGELLRSMVVRGRTILPKNIDDEPHLRNFIDKTLQHDPRERMTADEALAHPFLNRNEMPCEAQGSDQESAAMTELLENIFMEIQAPIAL